MGSEVTERDTLVVGPADHPEMAEVLTVLRRYCPDHSLHHEANLEDAIRAFEQHALVCDFGLVLHTVPGEHQQSDVLRLLTAAPLTRWLIVNGVWCESVGRTENVWPLSFQVPLLLFESRLTSELQVLAGEKTALAATAGRDEMFEFNVPNVPEPPPFRRILVESPDPAISDWIYDSLARHGIGAVESATEADVIVLDTDPWNDLAQLDFPIGSTSTPIIVIQSMTTPESTRELIKHGIAAVVPKLAINHLLPDAIVRATA